MTEKDDRIKAVQNLGLSSINFGLVQAHQVIGEILVRADDDTSDRLVTARTYINMAMKELKKIDADK